METRKKLRSEVRFLADTFYGRKTLCPDLRTERQTGTVKCIQKSDRASIISRGGTGCQKDVRTDFASRSGFPIIAGSDKLALLTGE